jgi:hypothetical protein
MGLLALGESWLGSTRHDDVVLLISGAFGNGIGSLCTIHARIYWIGNLIFFSSSMSFFVKYSMVFPRLALLLQRGGSTETSRPCPSSLKSLPGSA